MDSSSRPSRVTGRGPVVATPPTPSATRRTRRLLQRVNRHLDRNADAQPNGQQSVAPKDPVTPAPTMLAGLGVERSQLPGAGPSRPTLRHLTPVGACFRVPSFAEQTERTCQLQVGPGRGRPTTPIRNRSARATNTDRVSLARRALDQHIRVGASVHTACTGSLPITGLRPQHPNTW